MWDVVEIKGMARLSGVIGATDIDANRKFEAAFA